MKRKITTIFSIVLITVLLTACGKENLTYAGFKDLTPVGAVNYETSTLGIDASDPKLESKLTDGEYYVLHDGVYYPVYQHAHNEAFGDKISDTIADRRRQIYFTTETEINIPTLFLNAGDKLIYYSKNALLGYITWERFYCLGYTLPIASINTIENGRIYIDLTTDDKETVNILLNSSLRDLNYRANQDKDNFLYALIDKISNNDVDYTCLSGIEADDQNPVSKWYSNKIIDPALLNKGELYDLEIYNGTNYLHYTETASMLAMRAYESYITGEYTCLRDCFYEISVPDFFLNGYYFVGGMGLVRIVHEDSYSEATEYNEQLLFPSIERGDDPDAYKAPRVYSTIPYYNKFTTNVAGAFGYVDENATTLTEEATLEDKTDTLRKASVKTIDLWLPKDKTYTVEIISPTGEKTGSLILKGDYTLKNASYNRMSDNYIIQAKGSGEKVTLTISGFYNSYTINLTNAEVYDNQDAVATPENTETKEGE